MFQSQGVGGTPRKIWWGCAARFPQPLPYLWPKYAIFPTLFMTWPLHQNPVKARLQKPYPIYDKNDQNKLKSISYLWPKRLKNPTLWGRTYLYRPYIKGSTPNPRVKELILLLSSDFFRCADRLCVAVRFWKKQQKRISFQLKFWLLSADFL